MTRALKVLMNFASEVAKSEDPRIPDVVKKAAELAMVTASQLRSENAIVFIGTETDDSSPGVEKTSYFGSEDAARAWVKLAKGTNRSYRTEDLLY